MRRNSETRLGILAAAIALVITALVIAAVDYLSTLPW
jgi:hypothetical protein